MNWFLTCSAHYRPATPPWCAISRRELRITLSADGDYEVIVGLSHKTTSDRWVIVDAAPPIRAVGDAKFAPEQVRVVLELLRSGRKVTTGYIGEDGKPVTEQLELFGAPQALDLLAWTVAAIPKQKL